MRRVSVVFALLAVFALSAPAFANYILVYKGTIKPNAFNEDNDTLLTSTATCYVILDIDETNGNLSNSAIVIYGKRGGVKVYRDDKVDGYEWPYLYVYLWWEPDYDTASHGVIEIYDYSEYSVDGYAVGRAKLENVGEASKRLVASSPAGSLVFGLYDAGADAQMLDPDEDLYGSARVELDLANSMTKSFNKAGAGISGVLFAIETDLEDHGYVWWNP